MFRFNVHYRLIYTMNVSLQSIGFGWYLYRVPHSMVLSFGLDKWVIELDEVSWRNIYALVWDWMWIPNEMQRHSIFSPRSILVVMGFSFYDWLKRIPILLWLVKKNDQSISLSLCYSRFRWTCWTHVATIRWNRSLILQNTTEWINRWATSTY